jgi:UTP--glucose-1-phosphate uridylyltransferase
MIKQRKITTAIFPVGGLGTRFLPATKSMPKEMLPIANKPIIQYAFEEARNAGIEKFIFVTGRNKNAINNHFDHSYELESKLDEKNKKSKLDKIIGWMPEAGHIAFIRQQKPLGLGHAIWCARNFISNDEAFIVILADEMMMENDENRGSFLKKMMNFYYQENKNINIIAVDKVENKDVNKYGIIDPANNNANNDGSNFLINNMVEKPNVSEAPSNLAITGRYILQPEIFSYLENTKIGSGGEIQLTDAMKSMITKFDFYYQEIGCPRFDCGNVLGYIEANIAFAINNQDIKDDVKNILKKYQ